MRKGIYGSSLMLKHPVLVTIAPSSRCHLVPAPYLVVWVPDADTHSSYRANLSPAVSMAICNTDTLYGCA